VIGCGPAGIGAAVELKQAGVEVPTPPMKIPAFELDHFVVCIY